MIVGPLLTRYKKGYVPRPGGDKIGRRRLDTHFIGFKKLGATFVYDSKEEFYRVSANQLTGTNMLLDEASVTYVIKAPSNSLEFYYFSLFY